MQMEGVWLWPYLDWHYLRCVVATVVLGVSFCEIRFFFFFLTSPTISSCLPESPETEAAMEVGATEVVESEVFYDCVICGQSGPSTEDRPIGLVVLLQASSGNSLHLPEFPHSHSLFLQCWLFHACNYGNFNIFSQCLVIGSAGTPLQKWRSQKAPD